MKLWKAISEFMKFWLKIDRKYQKLANDPEKKEKSINLGVQSIVQVVLFGTIFVLLLLGAEFCYNNFVNLGKFPIFSLIGMVSCVIFAIPSFVEGVIGALIYLIYQAKLNKRPIKWIALVVWILVIAIMIGFVIIIFTK